MHKKTALLINYYQLNYKIKYVSPSTEVNGTSIKTKLLINSIFKKVPIKLFTRAFR